MSDPRQKHTRARRLAAQLFDPIGQLAISHVFAGSFAVPIASDWHACAECVALIAPAALALLNGEFEPEKFAGRVRERAQGAAAQEAEGRADRTAQGAVAHERRQSDAP